MYIYCCYQSRLDILFHLLPSVPRDDVNHTLACFNPSNIRFGAGVRFGAGSRIRIYTLKNGFMVSKGADWSLDTYYVAPFCHEEAIQACTDETFDHHFQKKVEKNENES